MSEATEASGSGLGFGTVLFLIFLVLKLAGVISWSWWLVTSPLWIPFVLSMFILSIFFIAGLIMRCARYTR